MSDDNRRLLRVSELVRSHLGTLLARELGDPELSSVVITKVEVSKDLSIARISVRTLIGADDPERRKRVIVQLGRVASRLRRALGPSLGLRRVPELRFVYDTDPDKSARVDALLAEIEREKN